MRDINNNRAFSYSELSKNNIAKFSKVSSKPEAKCFGNEIFCCIAIAALLLISIGGSHLIQNRTRQHLIYNSVLQTPTNSDY